MEAPNDLLNIGGRSWLKRGEVVEAAVDSFSLLRRAHRELAKMEMHAPRDTTLGCTRRGCTRRRCTRQRCTRHPPCVRPKDARVDPHACVQKIPASASCVCGKD